MERAKLWELVCALPTHLFAEGERGWTVKTSGSNITQQEARHETNPNQTQNTKLELCKASWYGTTAFVFFFFFLTKKYIFLRDSVWARWEQLQVSLFQLEKLKGKYFYFPFSQNTHTLLILNCTLMITVLPLGEGDCTFCPFCIGKYRR